MNSGVTRSVVPLALGSGVAPMNLVHLDRIQYERDMRGAK